ncbi:MAG: hypothetical protein BZ151_11800 [Desulfobacca sp. 4484_104]|nr:MAG: hypothetical protein BZ151_11800 [Desulfobacca sp. 4484_104]RLA88859.1 MAG: hypothetical protein DRG58_06745 [Deltaproteobacteria bacterium]
MKKGIRAEIRRALSLYHRCGPALAADPQVRPRLDQYQEAICQTMALNRQLGISDACARCATTGFGSCCFLGIEHQYDYLFLLINLIFGVELPEEREIPNKCWFVGPQGCKLIARHYYCQRFLCPELKEQLGAAQCRQIREAVEAELYVGWELEQLVRLWLKVRGYNY